MKYYEMHEAVYQRIKEESLLSWDKSSTFEELWQHGTNTGLSKMLANVEKKLADLEVLDLGTGTGTSALFCAKMGARCVGVEVSKTAIELAKKNALTLGLDIEFINADILDLRLEKRFDVVVDSTVLHCIVGEDDRRAFYETAKAHLKEDGFLFINTMISEANTAAHFPEKFFHFADQILWSLGVAEVNERRDFNGKSYFAHRTLLSKQNQILEFAQHGFEVVSLEMTSDSEVRSLHALLRVKFF